MPKTKIKLVAKDSHIYNAVDHPDFVRGTKMVEGKLIKNSCALIYSVHFIDNKGMAHCQSWDCWGCLIEEIIPAKNLIPFEKN
jgi:hypothetical protein